MELGITEYWIVDPETRTVTVVAGGRPDARSSSQVTWRPSGVHEPLSSDVATLFD